MGDFNAKARSRKEGESIVRKFRRKKRNGNG